VASRGDGANDAGGAEDQEESYAGEGALAGAATGAGIGALWGLGILAGVLPAIGPAIAGGTLAVLLSSAAVGAAAAGIAGALIGMGISKEEAEYYEGEVRSGRTLVTVRADARFKEAQSILTRFGGYDYRSPAIGSAPADASATGSVHGHTTLDVPVTKENVASEPGGLGAGPVSTSAPVQKGRPRKRAEP
jgi:hypothetical protein